MFHALDRENEAVSFDPECFARGMAELASRGYRTLRLVEIERWLRGDTDLPQRVFVLTFDDGYRSVYDVGFSILQRLGFTATVFLTVSETRSERLPSMLRRSMLSFAEVREMARHGLDFGAHTLSHPVLPEISDAQIEHEVRRSKQIIEDEIGTEVATFAYPFGRFDARSRDIVSRHFAIACSDRLALADATSDRLTLPRIDAYYLRGAQKLGWIGHSFFPWYVRARSIPRGLRRQAMAMWR